MKNFKDYTKADYERIAADIIGLSKKNVNQLYRVLGHATHDLGIVASDEKGILFKRVDVVGITISAARAYNFVTRTAPLNEEKAETRGKVFWKKFSKKIQQAICENKDIQKIISGEANLKDMLVKAIPAILGLIAVGVVLSPVYIALISIALAIIIKAGLGAYCEME